MATRLDQSDFVKTALRLPPALHAAVHASAEASGRSYNAELIALIEAGLNPKNEGDAIKAVALSLAMAQRDAANWAVSAHHYLLDLVLVCYSFQEVIDTIEEMGIEGVISDEDKEEFIRIAEGAHLEYADLEENPRALVEEMQAAHAKVEAAEKAMLPRTPKTPRAKREAPEQKFAEIEAKKAKRRRPPEL